MLKVASTDNGLVDFERTEAVTALARAAGVPVPAVLAVLAVLAADNSGHAGRRYLLFEHVEGVSWPRVRPQLRPFQVAAAHRQLANAVLAAAGVPVQTLVFPDAIHGFLSIPLFEPAASQALEAIVSQLAPERGG